MIPYYSTSNAYKHHLKKQDLNTAPREYGTDSITLLIPVKYSNVFGRRNLTFQQFHFTLRVTGISTVGKSGTRTHNPGIIHIHSNSSYSGKIVYLQFRIGFLKTTKIHKIR